jgi:hypothetical protein
VQGTGIIGGYVNEHLRAMFGQPCQVVRSNEPLKFCGQPSVFIRLGIIPIGMTPEQAHAEHWNYTMLMCPECVNAYERDLGWHIKDGRIRIERLDVTKLRLKCDHCLDVFAIEWDPTMHESGNPGVLRFCPRCGQSAGHMAFPDPHLDFMDWVCEQYPGMPRQLVVMLYTEWPRNLYKTFRSYIDSQVADALDDTTDPPL